MCIMQVREVPPAMKEGNGSQHQQPIGSGAYNTPL